MRVLMTADTVGGVWVYALELARGLGERGVRVHLVTCGRPLSPAQTRDAAAIGGLDLTPTDCRCEWMVDPWRDVQRFGEVVFRVARDVRPHVVHLNDYSLGSLPWDRPVVVVGHSCVCTWWGAVRGGSPDPGWSTYARRIRAGLAGADAFVAPTAAMMRAFEACHPLPRRRCVIYNGLPDAPTTSAAKRPFVFAAGRLADEAKNLAALDRAAAAIVWPVRVAGDADHAAHVQRLGWRPRAQMHALFAAASIYCLPVRYEPFGLSILEAARAGCALVLGDIATQRELWDGAAQFVPPDDPGRLARTVNDLIDDPARRCALARTAKARAARYDARTMSERYLDLYRRLTPRRGTTSAMTRSLQHA